MYFKNPPLAPRMERVTDVVAVVVELLQNVGKREDRAAALLLLLKTLNFKQKRKSMLLTKLNSTFPPSENQP